MRRRRDRTCCTISPLLLGAVLLLGPTTRAARAAIAVDVAVGDRQTCAVSGAGTVSCWTRYQFPTPVAALADVVAVDVSESDGRAAVRSRCPRASVTPARSPGPAG